MKNLLKAFMTMIRLKLFVRLHFWLISILLPKGYILESRLEEISKLRT